MKNMNESYNRLIYVFKAYAAVCRYNRSTSIKSLDLF